MNMYTQMNPHTHVKCAKHDTHEGGHLQFLYMYILVCTHVHACADTSTHIPSPEPGGPNQ